MSEVITYIKNGFHVNTKLMEVGMEYEFTYEDSTFCVSIDKDRTMKIWEIA